jgi:hypothetical protein
LKSLKRLIFRNRGSSDLFPCRQEEGKVSGR